MRLSVSLSSTNIHSFVMNAGILTASSVDDEAWTDIFEVFFVKLQTLVKRANGNQSTGQELF